MIYFYYGDDSFRAKETVDALRKKFIELYDPSGHNIVTLYHDDMTLESFNNAVTAQGFLAEKKMIIIRNIFNHKKFKVLQESILEYLKKQKNNKDENYIVFWHEGSPKKTTKLFKYLYKRCSENNCSREVALITGAQLIAWVQRHANQFSKKLSIEASEHIINMIGNDTWQLHHEIKKLSFHNSSPNITIDDIEKNTSDNSVESIFILVDAIGAKNKKTALNLLNQQMQHGQDAGYLLSMIIRQFRLITQAHSLLKTNTNAYAIAQQLQTPTFVAQKLITQSSYYTLGQLSNIYSELVNMDIQLKSDPDNFKVAITNFVASL